MPAFRARGRKTGEGSIRPGAEPSVFLLNVDQTTKDPGETGKIRQSEIKQTAETINQTQADNKDI